MTTDIGILILLSIATLANVLVTAGVFVALEKRLALLQDDVSAIRIRPVPVNVGGRLTPSQADLEAARNRMDKLGIARPGGPG